jgi:hypothetical protein
MSNSNLQGKIIVCSNINMDMFVCTTLPVVTRYAPKGAVHFSKRFTKSFLT